MKTLVWQHNLALYSNLITLCITDMAEASGADILAMRMSGAGAQLSWLERRMRLLTPPQFRFPPPITRASDWAIGFLTKRQIE